MTQIECNSNGASSPPPLLKLGFPAEDSKLMMDESTAAAAVFKISPEEALQQLCDNVERLNAYFASSTTTTDPNSFCSTLIGSETPAEEGLAVKSVGLHCGNGSASAQDPATRERERTKEESFQMAILSRKFLSKKIPPISLQDYLLRLHRYCPMSTAVFLATSVYITRMTLVEKMFRVTPKNMHRLLLAGLLVAIKALEDQGYPHTRIAKVGGVTNLELSKLEISFCFLADFDLRVDARLLMGEMHLEEAPAAAPMSPGPE